MRHTAKVGCIHPGELKTQPGRDPKVGKLVEEELKMVWAWLYNRDLLMDHNGKELPLEWALMQVLGTI